MVGGGGRRPCGGAHARAFAVPGARVRPGAVASLHLPDRPRHTAPGCGGGHAPRHRRVGDPQRFRRLHGGTDLRVAAGAGKKDPGGGPGHARRRLAAGGGHAAGGADPGRNRPGTHRRQGGPHWTGFRHGHPGHGQDPHRRAGRGGGSAAGSPRHAAGGVGRRFGQLPVERRNHRAHRRSRAPAHEARRAAHQHGARPDHFRGSARRLTQAGASGRGRSRCLR